MAEKTPDAHMAMPFVWLRGVFKRYQSLAGEILALRGIDLDVAQGEYLAITGKSGSGKTTLVNMLTGLDRSDKGEIWVGDAAIHRMDPEAAARWRGVNVGVVFQTFELLPTLSIMRNVMIPMDLAGRYTIRQRKERAMRLLEQMEIAEHASKLPAAISGGQQQRVAIARALANDPQLLVADEPTGSLDSSTAEAVIKVLETSLERGRTLLVVSHDADIAARACRTVTLVDGQIESQKRSRGDTRS
jgi:ABC-type lipoprotein export system ATPase subunit